ncbi:MAG: hypothetical protein B7Y45_04225 [Sphingomonas sp. 28-66-16]|nr:MAG: hypothetical protein B7Y45_04225 [Sphingomonas sp. 28-66-16]
MILFLLALVANDPPPVPNPAPKKVSATSPDKIVCRQFPVTGSLVQTYKTCKTVREWDMEREAVRASNRSPASCGGLAEGGGC